MTTTKKTTTTGTRGGRRHGLDDDGAAVTRRFTLGDAAAGAIDELAAAHGLSRSGVVRVLVTDPGAWGVVLAATSERPGPPIDVAHVDAPPAVDAHAPMTTVDATTIATVHPLAPRPWSTQPIADAVRGYVADVVNGEHEHVEVAALAGERHLDLSAFLAGGNASDLVDDDSEQHS